MIIKKLLMSLILITSLSSLGINTLASSDSNIDTLANDISLSDIRLSENEFIYNGSEQKPIVTIDGLDLNVDYRVSYLNDLINAGKKKIRVSGINDYSFSYILEYNILKANNIITLELNSDYEPIISTLAGEYQLSYYRANDLNNKLSIRPTTPGDYIIRVYVEETTNYNEASYTYPYTIAKYGISEDMIKLSEDEFIYNGSNQRPIVTIDGLKLGTDFIVEYPESINSGEKILKVKGIGSYSFNYELSYSILKRSTTISIKEEDGYIVPTASNDDVRIVYKYYSDEECKNNIEKPIKDGIYYVKAIIEEDTNNLYSESNTLMIVIDSKGKDSYKTMKIAIGTALGCMVIGMVILEIYKRKRG